MNKEELKNKLDELAIRPSDYSLDGTLKPMSTILYFEDPDWLIFDCDERGRIENKMRYDQEEKACEHILYRMISLKAFRERYDLK